MQPKLLFEDKDLGRAFQELNETWEMELPIEASLKGFLEGLMAEERAAYLGAGVRERTPKRRDWANGHYVRDLGTEGGLIRALRVPRVRGGGFQSRVLPRYRRRRAVVDRTLRDCFLAGVSTRRVGACVKGLLGEAVSASTVSRVCTALSRDVAAFHDRPLSDRYRYVFLDALGAKVRVAPRSRSKVLLCAMGVTLGGRRELIDFRLANSESEPTWTKFLDEPLPPRAFGSPPSPHHHRRQPGAFGGAGGGLPLHAPSAVLVSQDAKRRQQGPQAQPQGGGVGRAKDLRGPQPPDGNRRLLALGRALAGR